MNLTLAKNAVTSKVARQVLVAQKHSPTLLFGAGMVGVVATTVLACRATLKLEYVLDDAEKMEEKIVAVDAVNYSEKDRQHDLTVLKVKTVIEVAKLYAPAVGIGILSIAALTGSHVIINRRNVALMAAYSALEQSYNEYRKRVVEDAGVEKDQEYRYGNETREIAVDTKDGTKIKHIRTVPAQGLSGYARMFAPDTTNEWQATPEYNMFFIRCQQNFLNDRLRARGHVTLNDAYDALGLDRTNDGMVVGWVKGNGDGYIDFGLFRDDNMEEIHDFMTGREGAIWLDFNVDGLIYEKI